MTDECWLEDCGNDSIGLFVVVANGQERSIGCFCEPHAELVERLADENKGLLVKLTSPDGFEWCTQ